MTKKTKIIPSPTSLHMQANLDGLIRFHGHHCFGLSIGIRLVDALEKHVQYTAQNKLICIAETDMCAVDAIQYLTSCTLGKGSLILRDYGKAAFSFYADAFPEGIRLLFNENVRHTIEENIKRQTESNIANTFDKKTEMIKALLNWPLDELFTLGPAQKRPRPAQIMQSVRCEACGELAMESRIRLFAGKHLCLPCFMDVEQKQ